MVFFDVDPGKHNVSVLSPSTFYYSVANLASPLKVTAGEVYYFQVIEKEGERLDYLTSLVKDKTNYPIRIVPVQEAEAKKEIKQLLKLKESGEEKKSVASVATKKQSLIFPGRPIQPSRKRISKSLPKR